jgi:hypothetical protein
MLKKSQSPGTADDESAHVRDVKNPCTLTGGQMLLQDTGRVKNRHFPAREFYDLGA